MSRSSLKLRKPGQSAVGLSPAEIEAFIQGADEPPSSHAPSEPAKPAAAPEIPTPAPMPAPIQPVAAAPLAVVPAAAPEASPPAEPVEIPTFRRANRSLAPRKTKPDRRRTTVYMDLQLARRLAHHCHAQDEDMSDVVNRALAAWLDSSPTM